MRRNRPNQLGVSLQSRKMTFQGYFRHVIQYHDVVGFGLTDYALVTFKMCKTSA